MTDVVASPCINLCRMDADSGLCLGCLRTLDEIVRWGSAGEADQRAILARVAERRRVRDRHAGGLGCDRA